ncbi:MAG TPA: RidA family protein [Methylomirabilota bacterium]|jgi:enamine deaminase RidA (YjgF/YER057c/UK114 family)|nr:RidA family protein [Methylomirabilota bacterium]
MPKIEKFSANGVFDPPTYSQGIKVSDAQTVLFLAGQVAYDKDGGVLHRGDFKSQAREAFRCLKALVEAGGGRMDSIVKVNTYVTDIRYRADLVPVRAEFFGTKGPASTLVQVSALAHPDWLIEVEAIAVV